MMRKAVSEFSQQPTGFSFCFFLLLHFSFEIHFNSNNYINFFLLYFVVVRIEDTSNQSHNQQPAAKRRKEEAPQPKPSKSFGLSFSFTEPQAPVFRTDERAQAKKEAEEAAALAMATLANSSPHPSAKYHSTESFQPIEGAPHFSVEERIAQRRAMRPPVKSTAEREEEELQKVFFSNNNFHHSIVTIKLLSVVRYRCPSSRRCH